MAQSEGFSGSSTLMNNEYIQTVPLLTSSLVVLKSGMTSVIDLPLGNKKAEAQESGYRRFESRPRRLRGDHPDDSISLRAAVSRRSVDFASYQCWVAVRVKPIIAAGKGV